MTVRTNTNALFAHRNLMLNQAQMNKAVRRLSSGYRINSAADDAAGLAISEKMRGQIRGLRMASRNAQNAISMLQTAEGGLNEVHAILQRMRELAVQSANGTYDNDVDRYNLDKEYQTLMEEINRISSYTNYNGIPLLNGTSHGVKGNTDVLAHMGLTALDAYGGGSGDAKLNVIANDDGTVTYILQRLDETVMETRAAGTGTFDLFFEDGTGVTIDYDTTKAKSGTITNLDLAGDASGSAVVDKTRAATEQDLTVFQIGANGGKDQQLGMYLPDMSTALLGTEDLPLWDTNIRTQDAASAAIDALKAATDQVSGARASIGAQINRLEFTINNLETTAENLEAAESRIRDADMAEEMMNYVKYSILVQAAQAMLAQSMQQPNYILQLLNSL